MTRLVWDEIQARRYEAGVDRGVLYPSSGPGVVWNGLLSVEESFVGGETEEFYIDGVKYLDFVSTKDYQATINAFSAPEEFARCIGEKHLIPGFVVTRQPRERFGFSYRTGGSAYKLHLVYNALATPKDKSYETTGDEVKVSDMTWTIDAIPHRVLGHRPSSHYILDSKKSDPEALAVIEDLLYGSESQLPSLPLISDIINALTSGGVMPD